jgi:putative component of toxin-antitoxin plasmid stabilization module
LANPVYALEFYQDPEGHEPVRDWLKTELSSEERRTVGAAMRTILQEQGVNVCGSSFGRQLGKGLFEFRLREESLLVRVFCHAFGNRLILLLGGYDKGQDPSERRQNQEIETARVRLDEWKSRSED